MGVKPNGWQQVLSAVFYYWARIFRTLACSLLERGSCSQFAVDFVVPDERFVEAFGRKLSRFGAVRITDPGHAITGHVVVPLDEYLLAFGGDPADLLEPRTAPRNFVSTRPLRRHANFIADHFHREGDGQPKIAVLSRVVREELCQ